MNFLRSKSKYAIVLTLGFWFAAAGAQTGYVVDELHPNEPSYRFGSSVAISGKTAVVVTSGHDAGAYVFERSGSSWGTPNKLPASATLTVPLWAQSVAISGDTIVFGDQGDDDVDTNAGAAYVFVRQDAGWVQEAKLFANDAARVAAFGWSVAIDGDTAVVGALQEGVIGDRPGAAYVFHRVGLNWTQQAKLLASDGRDRDDFGRSVDISGDTVVVGALERQAAYVFQRTDSSWHEQAKLHVPIEWFGSSVAVSDDTILVGSYVNSCCPEHNGAYLYERNGTTWSFQKQLPDEEKRRQIMAVDLDGDTALLQLAASPGGDRLQMFDRVDGDWLRTGSYDDDVYFSTALWGSARLSGRTAISGSHDPNDVFAGIAKVIRFEELFADVSTDHWAFGSIEDISLSGITSGCRDSDYCPDDFVTRAQMAVLLERGINGSGYNPPAASGSVFADVEANDFAASFIEQLALDGITGGCGGNNFCPDNSVTRAQMAVLLLRAKHGADYSPPTAAGTVFADVDTSYWAVAWIEQLAAEGLTTGCGSGNYCPDDPVTRAQMAVFLVRTFEL